MNKNIARRRIMTLKEIRATKIGESNEPLVRVNEYDPRIQSMNNVENDTQYFLNGDIVVRQEVALKLSSINKKLGEYTLMISCGYRHPSVQKACFEKERANILINNTGISSDEADELTHALIAVPEVAGHITGGAIDLSILKDDGTMMDMGTKIADFSSPEKIPTYSKNISLEQKCARKLLHDLMVSENFAPFYGEWWHFSYGDREWAAFYEKESAIYGEYLI